MNDAKSMVEKLYKGNGKLYLACLCVGLITGAIVSCYRWGLGKIGLIRREYFSEVNLSFRNSAKTGDASITSTFFMPV